MRPSRARVRKCNDTTPRARCPNCVAPGAGGAHAGHRHRGLVRRRVAVRGRAAFVDRLESNRFEHLGEIEFEFFLATQPERIP
jgi:hypothetical protein